MGNFTRITHNVDIMSGKACIRGTRVTVGMIITQLSEGKDFVTILEEYPYLSQDDIFEALKYCAWLIESQASISVSSHRKSSEAVDLETKQFSTVFEYHDNMWIASCDELKITLEEGSFDALVVRMKVAIQEIAEVELGYKGDIRLVITMLDKIEEIKALG